MPKSQNPNPHNFYLYDPWDGQRNEIVSIEKGSVCFIDKNTQEEYTTHYDPEEWVCLRLRDSVDRLRALKEERENRNK